MPPRKKAQTQWVLGPGGTLVERGSAAARAPTVPQPSSSERLTDGLTSFSPRPVRPESRMEPWEKARHQQQALQGVRAEMRGIFLSPGSSPAVRSGSVSSVGSAGSAASTGSSARELREAARARRAQQQGRAPAPSPSPSPSPAPSPAPSPSSRAAASGGARVAAREGGVGAAVGGAATGKGVAAAPPPGASGVTATAAAAAKKRGRKRKAEDTSPQEAPPPAETIAVKSVRAAVAAPVPKLPPQLRCLPGASGASGSTVVVPAGFREILAGSGTPLPCFFELRGPMRMGNVMKRTVSVTESSFAAPAGCIVLPAAVQKALQVGPEDPLTFRVVHPPQAERLVLEAASSVGDTAPAAELEALVRAHIDAAHLVLERGEVFRTPQGCRFKVVELAPASPAATPVAKIAFRFTREAADGPPVQEVAVAEEAPGTVRTAPSRQGTARVRVMARAPADGTGLTLRLLAKGRNQAPAPVILYANQGDAFPHTREGGFAWGGSNSLDCPFACDGAAPGGAYPFLVLLKGEACFLHAYVLRTQATAAVKGARGEGVGQEQEDVAMLGGGGADGGAAVVYMSQGGGASQSLTGNVHDDALRHFKSQMRVPLPKDLAEWLPAGTDLLYLRSLDSVLDIENSYSEGDARYHITAARAAAPYEDACYTPPGAALWAQALPPLKIASMPLHLRLCLMLNLEAASRIVADHTAGLRELLVATGEEQAQGTYLLFYLLKALSARHHQVRLNALHLLQSFSDTST